VVLQNTPERAKRKVEKITVELEEDLLYPLLLWGDTRRWTARPSLHIIMTQDPQTRRGLDEEFLQSNYPKTWAYLKRFENILKDRSGFKRYFTRIEHGKIIETGPFYSMFNVGDYTFSPCKVVWPNMGDRIDASVVVEHEGKPIVPQHIISLLPLSNLDEAFYVAAVINSSPFQFAAHSYSQAGGKSFGTPQILEYIYIPTFDPNNTTHQQLVDLSKKAHQLANSINDDNAQSSFSEIEVEIDQLTKWLWGLTDKELQDVCRSLAELKGGSLVEVLESSVTEEDE